MLILGIDPGLSCGWAVRLPSGAIESGTWNLRGNRFEGAGMRMIRFRRYLEEALASGVQLVAFEEVRRHMGVDAAHLYGAITHRIMEVCQERGIPYQGISVGTVKKTATGKGNADKDAMIAAANRQWGLHLGKKDDNEADARWIAETAAIEQAIEAAGA